jgi:signal transduction histidine kinase
LSIKIKWTLVVVSLLLISILFTGYFVLDGLSENQQSYYIDNLQSKSKDINLYIRESFISSDYDDFKDYYLIEGEKIAYNLKRVINMPVELLDNHGQLISNGENIKEIEDIDTMSIAINGNPVYEKSGRSIVYLAPIYDFNEQIGICRIHYNSEKEDMLYEDVKKLFIKIGFISISLVSILGMLYFSKIANIILNLKTFVADIGEGNYEQIEYVKTGDELEELSLGIIDLSKIIKENISSLKEEKEKLELMIKRLKELELQQKEFIGNITHEFKTPLTILKIQVDLIDLYKDDEEIISNAKNIMNKEIIRLNSMVENILYLSKIQKYEYEFNKEKINTKEILEEIISRLKNRAFNSKITIESKLIEEYLYIDKDSFVRIFVNLIDNAIKYNNIEGKVYVESFIENNNLKICITSTGNEIVKEDLEKIFELFYIVDTSRNKKISGTGLGLPLVKNLIEKQNGKISVSSNKGLNTFTVLFKLIEDSFNN